MYMEVRKRINCSEGVRKWERDWEDHKHILTMAGMAQLITKSSSARSLCEDQPCRIKLEGSGKIVGPGYCTLVPKR